MAENPDETLTLPYFHLKVAGYLHALSLFPSPNPFKMTLK